MNDDIEIWLMFAPFWLLGLAALVGSVWHMIHFALVHRRAQAAGHVRKAAPSSGRLQWHELSPDGWHHLKRALIAIGIFIGLCIGGLVVGFAAGLVMRA